MPRSGFSAFASGSIGPGQPTSYFRQPYRTGSGFSRQVVLTVQGEYHGVTVQEHSATPTNVDDDDAAPAFPGGRRLGAADKPAATPAEAAAAHRILWAPPDLCAGAPSPAERTALSAAGVCRFSPMATAWTQPRGLRGAPRGLAEPGNMDLGALLSPGARASTAAVYISTYGSYAWDANPRACANDGHVPCLHLDLPASVVNVFRMQVPARTSLELVISTVKQTDSALVVLVSQERVPSDVDFDHKTVAASTSIPLHNCGHNATDIFVSVLSHNSDGSPASATAAVSWYGASLGACDYYTWVTGPWGACSTPCGVGIVTRDLWCEDQVGRVVDASLCPPNTPDASTFCDNGYCDWVTSDWSTCTKQCGGGTQSRSVDCKNGDGSGEVVPEGMCTTGRPAGQQGCNEWVCPSTAYWIMTPWGMCTAECGGGFRVRQVYCSNIFAWCPGEFAGNRPASIEPCNAEPCAQAHYTLTYTDIRQVRSGASPRTDSIDSASLMYYQYHRFTGAERGVCITATGSPPSTTIGPGSSLLITENGAPWFATVMYINADGTPTVTYWGYTGTYCVNQISAGISGDGCYGTAFQLAPPHLTADSTCDPAGEEEVGACTNVLRSCLEHQELVTAVAALNGTSINPSETNQAVCNCYASAQQCLSGTICEPRVVALQRKVQTECANVCSVDPAACKFVLPVPSVGDRVIQLYAAQYSDTRGAPPTSPTMADWSTASTVPLQASLMLWDEANGYTNAIQSILIGVAATGPAVTASVSVRSLSDFPIKVLGPLADAPVHAAQIVAGGLVVVIELLCDVFVAPKLNNTVVATNLLMAGFVADQASRQGWNRVAKPQFLASGASEFVTFDDRMQRATVTLPPVPDYSPSNHETITITIPGFFLRSGVTTRVQGATVNVVSSRVDCLVGEWSAWSVCTERCSDGWTQRMRVVTTPPTADGASCPALVETRSCNPCNACVGVVCHNGGQCLGGSCACPPGFNGTSCELPPSAAEAHYYRVSPWGTCTKTCGGGQRVRAVTCYTVSADGVKPAAGDVCSATSPNAPVSQVPCNTFACTERSAVVRIGLAANFTFITASLAAQTLFENTVRDALASALALPPAAIFVVAVESLAKANMSKPLAFPVLHSESGAPIATTVVTCTITSQVSELAAANGHVDVEAASANLVAQLQSQTSHVRTRSQYGPSMSWAEYSIDVDGNSIMMGNAVASGLAVVPSGSGTGSGSGSGSGSSTGTGTGSNTADNSISTSNGQESASWQLPTLVVALCVAGILATALAVQTMRLRGISAGTPEATVSASGTRRASSKHAGSTARKSRVAKAKQGVCVCCVACIV